MHRNPLLLLLALLPLLPAPEADAQESEQLMKGWLTGPAVAALGAHAQIEVPEGYLFADEQKTRELMEAMGNPPTGNEVGLIAPDSEDEGWFVVFEDFPVGYVDNEDKEEIDADALLQSISEGTEQANELRKKQGITPIHVTGWFEEPHYDEASDNLVWALAAKDEEGGETINHNIRLLGRRGYISATLVTDPAKMASDKRKAEAVLADFYFTPGNRYAEFRKGDKLAGYGLTALVAGGAGAMAVKMGLFAKLGKLLAKMWKALALGLVALGAAIKRLFGRGTSEPA